MKVLLICTNDWANVGGAMLKNASLVKDLELWGLKRHKHKFGYTDQMPTSLPLDDRHFDILHVLHSDVTCINWASEIGITWKKLVVQHGGTVFRQNADRINEQIWGRADMTLFETPDLYHLADRSGGALCRLWAPPLTLDPRLGANDAIVCTDPTNITIGHFPSNPVVKGSAVIERVMYAMQRDFPNVSCKLTTEQRSWEETLVDMLGCDIVIDALAPFQRAAKYGAPGVQAREAAYLGKCVITHNLWASDDMTLPFLIANDSITLDTLLRGLVTCPDNIDKIKSRSASWALAANERAMLKLVAAYGRLVK